MNKRVHEIAKERGLPAKEVLTRLKAAGLDVKAASASVDETAAQRVLGNGEAPVAKAPVAKAPVAKAPVAKAPVAKAPVAKAPVAKAPVAKAPVAKAPVAKASPDRAAPAIQTRTAAATKAPEGVPDPAPRAGEVNGAPLDGDGDGDARSANSEAAHKRPTRDSLQGERTP